MTSPPVQVQRGMEVLLPKSFCAFDFAASPQLLHETLARLEKKDMSASYDFVSLWSDFVVYIVELYRIM